MNNYPRSIFAQRLIEARKQKGWTQMNLAVEVGTNQQSVSFWEIDRSYPRVDTLIKIVKALDVSADWLLGLMEEQK